MTDLYKDYPSVAKVAPSDINGRSVSKFPGFGMIMFYSHSCPHCHSAVDEWVLLSKILEDIKIGAFNCGMDEEHQKVSSSLGISTVPTIKMVENGQLKDYGKGRSKSDIINYLCDEVDNQFCKHKTKISSQTSTPRVEVLDGGSRRIMRGGSSCSRKKKKSARGGSKVKKCKGVCKNGKKCKNNVAKGRRKYCNTHGK